MPLPPSAAMPEVSQERLRETAGFAIALDWGTTNLRAFLLDGRGAVVGEREKPWGILCLPAPAAAGGFDQALEAIAGDWMAANPGGPLIASGMVGSAQGWHEAPYVRCPAGAEDLAPKMTRIATASGRDLMIVPGLLLDEADLLPDVVRGEETQVIGALQELQSLQPRPDAAGSDVAGPDVAGPDVAGPDVAGPDVAGPKVGGNSASVCFVLPGTHSKWILVKDERIVQFATYMTGELFASLRQHSILGRLMPTTDGSEAHDAVAAAAYLQALHLARESGPGDLMRHLFTARSMNLAGRLPVTALSDYLSGLLIGHELTSATAWLRREAASGTEIVLIGEPGLLRRYAAALASFGLRATSLRNTAAAGMHRLLNLSGGRSAAAAA